MSAHLFILNFSNTDIKNFVLNFDLWNSGTWDYQFFYHLQDKICGYVFVSNEWIINLFFMKRTDLLRNEICKAVEFSYLGNIWSEPLRLKIFSPLLFILYTKIINTWLLLKTLLINDVSLTWKMNKWYTIY